MERINECVEDAVYALEQFAIISLERLHIGTLSEPSLLRSLNQPQHFFLQPVIRFGG